MIVRINMYFTHPLTSTFKLKIDIFCFIHLSLHELRTRFRALFPEQPSYIKYLKYPLHEYAFSPPNFAYNCMFYIRYSRRQFQALFSSLSTMFSQFCYSFTLKSLTQNIITHIFLWFPFKIVCTEFGFLISNLAERLVLSLYPI